MSWRDRILKWVEPEDNPRGTIYGTIAAGLIIAAEDPSTATTHGSSSRLPLRSPSTGCSPMPQCDSCSVSP